MHKLYLHLRFSALLVVFFSSFASFSLFAQPLSRIDSLELLENGTLLRSGMAGGFNQPQFSEIDLNGDAIMDLIVFDRAGDAIIPFLNGGTPNTVDYQFAPEYVDAFPEELEDWMLARDYNCDGKMDLFAGSDDGIAIYENTSTPGNLSFTKVIDTLKSDRGAGPVQLYVPFTDVPAIKDIDGDGDMDILTFDAGGNFVEFHKNMQVENAGNCAGLSLMLADACWGKFRENALSQDVVLNQTCRVRPTNATEPQSGVHAGSTLALFDEDGDGNEDLLVGDLLFEGLTFLHNGATSATAVMDSADNLFPIYDTPARLHIFPAIFIIDVDNDGKKDMLVAPNGASVSINYNNVWYYKNFDTGNGHRFSLQSRSFLVREMADVGMGAYPILFDYNGDSLMDILVGNFTYKLSISNVTSGLNLFENVGTATDPRFELVTRDFGNFSTIFTPEIFGMTPAAGDLDSDGDIDLLVGDSDGKVHFFENIAAPGQPANIVLAQANYKGIDIGQNATPVIVDIDRDGLVDLVIGELGGTLNYFHNIGTATQPDFASMPDNDAWGNVDTEPICCTGFSVPFILENPASGKYDLFVGSESGEILYFKDIESNLNGTFTQTSGNFGRLRVGGRTAIHAGDLNADGQMDWIVGNIRGGLDFYTGNDLLTAAAAPQDELLTEVRLHPNPSEGELNVAYQLKRGKQLSVSVADVSGRIIYQASQAGAVGEITISGDEWAPGVYFVSLQVDGQFAGVKKWVLTR